MAKFHIQLPILYFAGMLCNLEATKVRYQKLQATERLSRTAQMKSLKICLLMLWEAGRQSSKAWIKVYTNKSEQRIQSTITYGKLSGDGIKANMDGVFKVGWIGDVWLLSNMFLVVMLMFRRLAFWLLLLRLWLFGQWSHVHRHHRLTPEINITVVSSCKSRWYGITIEDPVWWWAHKKLALSMRRGTSERTRISSEQQEKTLEIRKDVQTDPNKLGKTNADLRTHSKTYTNARIQ